MILIFGSSDSGAREGDSGGRTGTNGFAPSELVTSGAGEIVDALPEHVVTGGK